MAQAINIKITEEGVKTGLQGGMAQSQAVPQQVNTNTNIVAKSVYTTMLVQGGINAIKKSFNAQAQLYGDITGDYIGQSKIDNAFQLGNNLLNIGGSIAGGFMVGGVPGAVVAGVVSVGSLALDTYNQGRSINLGIAKQNAGASFSSSQLGAILNNGNR